MSSKKKNLPVNPSCNGHCHNEKSDFDSPFKFLRAIPLGHTDEVVMKLPKEENKELHYILSVEYDMERIAEEESNVHRGFLYLTDDTGYFERFLIAIPIKKGERTYGSFNTSLSSSINDTDNLYVSFKPLDGSKNGINKKEFNISLANISIFVLPGFQ